MPDSPRRFQWARYGGEILQALRGTCRCRRGRVVFAKPRLQVDCRGRSAASPLAPSALRFSRGHRLKWLQALRPRGFDPDSAGRLTSDARLCRRACRPHARERFAGDAGQAALLYESPRPVPDSKMDSGAVHPVFDFGQEPGSPLQWPVQPPRSDSIGRTASAAKSSLPLHASLCGRCRVDRVRLRLFVGARMKAQVGVAQAPAPGPQLEVLVRNPHASFHEGRAASASRRENFDPIQANRVPRVEANAPQTHSSRFQESPWSLR